MEMFMKMKKKSGNMKYVDAMAVKDGYVAKPVSYEELTACNDKRYIKKGPYEMEYAGEESEDEEEME
jgi:hypothetical protein